MQPGHLVDLIDSNGALMQGCAEPGQVSQRSHCSYPPPTLSRRTVDDGTRPSRRAAVTVRRESANPFGVIDHIQLGRLNHAIDSFERDEQLVVVDAC